MDDLYSRLRSTIWLDPIGWASSCGVNLRPYQREIALAVKDSIIHHRGLTFVVILPRQSGKNELQAHLFAWLLFSLSHTGGRIVSVSPTFKPQTLNNMDRVRLSLDTCVGSRGRWFPSSGYMFSLGKSRLQFFSGESRANVVGATADLLLSVDEAQDVDPAKFDKDFDPMTASTNATRIFWGTAWTQDTLLERQHKLALHAQEQDGVRRVFSYTAEDVQQYVPAYGLTLARVIAEKGRNHPLVRSQYFCETIDAESTMFNPARLALIMPSPVSMGTGSVGAGLSSPAGSPPNENDLSGTSANPSGRPAPASAAASIHQSSFINHQSYAFLIDVAGMDENRISPSQSLDGMGLGNPGRDSTTLTIIEVDLSTLETLQLPTYRVVARHSWTGENHLAVFGKLKNLAETWSPQHFVIDATGVGEGLWAMLDRAFPNRVTPVKFTSQEKSEIGWRFLSIVETGRFIDPVTASGTDPVSNTVREQYTRCICEILPGPSRTLRWGVPDGARGSSGELVHDDFILADSLTAILDRMEWHLHFPSILIHVPQPDDTYVNSYDFFNDQLRNSHY